MLRRYCCLASFFPIVDACLSCEDIARWATGVLGSSGWVLHPCRCTDGGEIWHGGGDRRPLLLAKFHPHQCNVSPLLGERPQNRPLSKLNTGAPVKMFLNKINSICGVDCDLSWSTRVPNLKSIASLVPCRDRRGDTQFTKWGGLWKLEATQGYWKRRRSIVHT